MELKKLQVQLGQLDFIGMPAPAEKKRGAKVATPKSAKGAKAAAAIATGATTDTTTAALKKSKTASKLPATNTAFWVGLLSETPVSNQDILAAATTALKIRTSPADLQKLKQRLANFITIAIKDGTVQSEGAGRARRFFVRKPAATPGASALALSG